MPNKPKSAILIEQIGEMILIFLTRRIRLSKIANFDFKRQGLIANCNEFGLQTELN